ncbi:hypothetical protein AMTR_s00053p00156480 [Amborella trichopoda]|uniref:Uncharacterized protein n=1 Tax=Amborella trichopoda TaxID=13333 RepID=W1PBN1_AMBTC|nr:hypothetical protein AMTR_s00053p00156480 [Amborella trichopoda]
MAGTSSAPPSGLLTLFFYFFTVRVLDVNQQPREGELGTDSYTRVSLGKGTSLGNLEPTRKIRWPLSITYAGASTELCMYGGADGEPLIQRDGVTLYHALHRDFACSEDMPEDVGKAGSLMGHRCSSL